MAPPNVLVLNLGRDLHDGFPQVLQKAFSNGARPVPYSAYRKAIEHVALRPDKKNAFEMVIVDVGGDPPFDIAAVSAWLERSILGQTRNAVLVILCPVTAMNEWKLAITTKTRQERYDVVPRTHGEDDLVEAVKGALKKPQKNTRLPRIWEWSDPTH